MWWVSSVVIVYSIFIYNILNLVRIEMENLCIVCNILFTLVLNINVFPVTIKAGVLLVLDSS